MSYLRLFALFFTSILLWQCSTENNSEPAEEGESTSFVEAKGGLFIIGGGSRSKVLIQRMINAADLRVGDHVVILPMASSEPDSACWYIKQQLQEATEASIKCVKLAQKDTTNQQLLNEVREADLIYISGGDQNRFMDVVRGNAIQQAITDAYINGALVAGTSAGAAMMSEVMITGDQRKTEDYESTYSRLETKNGVYASGLGLLKTAIIDQHFIARSRYNRALTALYDYPTKAVFGIDEGTAILVKGNQVTVVGDAQVVVFRPPANRKAANEKIALSDVRLDVFIHDDTFELQPKSEAE